MPHTTRPFGITLLAVLQIILGILELLGAVAVAFVSFVLPEMFPHVRFFAPRSMGSGLALFVFAFVEFILAYGLWKGKGWAWIGSLIFAVIGLVFSAFTLFMRPRVGEAIALVLNLVIMYYLMQPRVQSYLGKGKLSVAASTSSTRSAGP
ncbi:MAG: DUF2127 domain-containing protein [Candidatus Bathyarchaeia archaeon]